MCKCRCVETLCTRSVVTGQIRTKLEEQTSKCVNSLLLSKTFRIHTYPGFPGAAKNNTFVFIALCFSAGLVTTQTPALFVPGLRRAPALSHDLLSAAGQGDYFQQMTLPPFLCH